MIDLAVQGQMLSRRHDGECAFCRWLGFDYVFALLVHLRVTLLLLAVHLPRSKAYVPAKTLLKPGSSQDLGQGFCLCQQQFNVQKDTHPLR